MSCITLASGGSGDRDRPQGVFLQPIACYWQKKQRSGWPEAALSQTAGSDAGHPYPQLLIRHEST